jgi:hypothetical protein
MSAAPPIAPELCAPQRKTPSTGLMQCSKDSGYDPSLDHLVGAGEE